MKEKLAEQYADIHMEQFDITKAIHLPYYHNDKHKVEDAFIAGYEAATKHLTEFQKGEIVQVTDRYHWTSNCWFEREFIQKDSDGQFACRQIDGEVCRWDYIRKIIK